jgi:hypothetical protein
VAPRWTKIHLKLFEKEQDLDLIEELTDRRKVLFEIFKINTAQGLYNYPMNYTTENILIDDTTQLNILIGKNAIGNEEIIRKSKPNDLWFHYSNMSGPHLILQCHNYNRGIIPKRYINEMAKMLLEKCNKKPSKIIYTQVKNVKIVPTETGSVITRNTKEIKM